MGPDPGLHKMVFTVGVGVEGYRDVIVKHHYIQLLTAEINSPRVTTLLPFGQVTYHVYHFVYIYNSPVVNTMLSADIHHRYAMNNNETY